jgi:hypothetical protein
MTAKSVCLAALVAFASVSASHSEEVCPTGTLGACWGALEASALNEGEAEVLKSLQPEKARTLVEQLIKKEVGFESNGSSLSSVLSDFLPLLTARIDASAISQDEVGLHVELNRFLFLPTDQNYRLQATFFDPALFLPIREALPAAVRESRGDELAKKLSQVDDVELSFFWSPVSKSLGRSHRRSGAYFEHMFQEAITEAEARQPKLEEELLQRRRAFFESVPGPNPLQADPPPGDARNKLTREMLAQVTEIADREREVAAAARGSLEGDAGIFAYADLLNNQPQLNVSGGARIKSKLAGPDEAFAKISYEHGFTNLVALERFCSAQRRDELGGYRKCFDAFRELPLRKADLAAQSRAAISIGYRFSDNYDFVSAADSVLLDLDSEHALVASLAFGRYLNFKLLGEEDREATRLDLSAGFETHFNDPQRHDRAVINATASRKVFAGLSLAVGFAWANRSEFRGDVDHEVTATFGLNYKLHRDE